MLLLSGFVLLSSEDRKEGVSLGGNNSPPPLSWKPSSSDNRLKIFCSTYTLTGNNSAP